MTSTAGYVVIGIAGSVIGVMASIACVIAYKKLSRAKGRRSGDQEPKEPVRVHDNLTRIMVNVKVLEWLQKIESPTPTPHDQDIEMGSVPVAFHQPFSVDRPATAHVQSERYRNWGSPEGHDIPIPANIPYTYAGYSANDNPTFSPHIDVEHQAAEHEWQKFSSCTSLGLKSA
ncbi:hypothetical protein DM02DRAFT_624213 [Periconia macrospinosa]|uniref:Uncharacterized protein n=1 Tax=Periconia macrospinosa TaxID=97972 RepID=A0A2V1E3Y9_9PLEO|nr:hypothetical protein DM02DRAFT_624213 [Periconia macrospinosa]